MIAGSGGESVTGAPVLPDQPARDRITGSLGETLFVEAGAGSGKTSSLVDRIVNLVADGGVPVNRIAAITFTEAAARELRTRVRDAMVERGVRGAGDVEAAAFTTLHGFALRMLTDHAIEAELPPGFGVVDEIASALDFERDWRLFIGQVGDDLGLLELQERAAALGIKPDSFASVARSFDDNWDLLQQWAELVDGHLDPLGPVGSDELLKEVAGLENVVGWCISDDDALCAGLLEVIETCRLLDGEDPLVQIQGLGRLSWPASNRGRKANWREPGVEAARSAMMEVRAAIEARVDALQDEVIGQFRTLVARHVLRRVKARQQSGQLSFHDLLVLARRLLRTDEEVRLRLHQRYTRILLDEFQDTDPIQIELAVLLAHPGPVTGRRWQDLAAELPAGRLAVVGDPKQAIYRFRRADIGVYGETEDVLVGETTKLVSNFRSVPGIVDWVNAVFSTAIGEGEPGAQPAYTPLAAIRGAHPKVDVPVTVLGHPHDPELGVGQIRELEAADVAAVVCRIMDEEWPVLVPQPASQGGPMWRPAQLRDIAVLIPSRLSLPSLESAFDAANVPFRPETSSLVYATQEVRDLVVGVRAVVDPTNSVDVVAALRSNLFAVDDQDLLAWKLADQGWDYRIDWPPDLDDSPVADAYRALRTWHGDRWWSEPAALIDRMIRERRLRELALAESRPRDRWRRYRFLTEQARLFTQSQGGDLQDFVDWVEIQSSDLARVTEPVPPEPDDDAVRVLTVHGAKGLEFPVAILAGAPSRDGGRRGGPQVLFTAEGWPEVKLGKDKRTSGFDVRASVEDVLDGHERIRLHYVAATRARDHLVVSAHHKPKLPSIGRRTWEIIGDHPELWRPFERIGDERYDVQPTTQLRLAGGDFDDDLARWVAGQRQVVTVNPAAGSRSASGLGVSDEPSGPRPARIGTGAGEPAPRAVYHGSLLGTVVHHVLQRLPLDLAPDDRRLDAEVGRLAGVWANQSVADENQTLDDEAMAALVADAAGRALGAARSSSFALARAHPSHRELYVGVPFGDGTLEGYLDLCVEGPDGWVIIDYKTDNVGDDDLDEFVAGYRRQLAAYALMLSTVTGRPVSECRLLLLRADGVRELTVPDLDAAVAEVELQPAPIGEIGE